MRKQIFYIILLAAVIRLYHIHFPVAGWHSWRQADTAAMARNFHENGFDFLHPQIDWGGNSSGIVESEFPVYPFLVSVIYAVFGVNDTWGRLVSVIFSLFTIYGLYLLVRKYLSDTVALWSAFLYAIIPLNIYYSRAFMPESAMLMCSVFGIYYFSQWLDNDSTRYFFLSALFFSVAILLKIPTLYLGLPLIYLAWLRFGKLFFKSGMLWLYAFLVLIPVIIWYYHSHQLFLKSGLTFGIWGFGSDKWGNFDVILTVKFYNDILFKSIAERHLTYAGFIPFLAGLFIKRTTRQERLFDVWLIAVFIYFLIVAKGNQVHEYYQLPFILPAVVFAGKAFARDLPLNSVRNPFASKPLVSIFFMLCLTGIVILSYLRYDRFMKSENYDSSLFRLASAVQEVTGKNDLVIAVSEYNPVVLYRCNRKGWNISADQLDQTFINEKKSEGAKYLIAEKILFNTPEKQKTLKWLIDNHKAEAMGTDYLILAL